MTTAKAQQFAIDVSWAFISSVITIPISFILRIFLARWLGASDLGIYQMTVTIYGIVMMAATFGIHTSIIKFAAEFQDSEDEFNTFISTGLVCAICFGLIVGVVTYASSGLFARVFHMPELSETLKILALIFPFTSLFLSLSSILNGLRWMRRYAFLVTLQSASMILFSVSLVAMGFGVNGAISGFVLSMALSSLMSFIAAKKYFSFDFSGLAQKARTLLRYGAILLGSDVMNVVSSSADVLLIGYFLTKTDVGLYSVALTLSLVLNFIPIAVQKVTYPASSETFAKQNMKQLHLMLDKSMKYSAMVLIPMGLAIALFSRPIVSLLFGEKYLAAVLPLNILLIGKVVRGSVTTPIGSLYTSVGKPGIAFLLDALASVVTILMLVILVPSLGIPGAAVSTSIATIIGTLVFVTLMPRFAGFTMDIGWYLRMSLMAALSIGVFSLASGFVNIIVAGIAILSFVVFLEFRFFLTPDDVHFLKHYIEMVKLRFSRI